MYLSSNYIRNLEKDLESNISFIKTDTADVLMDLFDEVTPKWEEDTESFPYKLILEISSYEITTETVKTLHKVLVVFYQEIQKYRAAKKDDEFAEFYLFNELYDYLEEKGKSFSVQSVSEFITDVGSYDLDYKTSLLLVSIGLVYYPVIFNITDSITIDEDNEIKIEIKEASVENLTIPEYNILVPDITYFNNSGFMYRNEAVKKYDEISFDVIKEYNKYIDTVGAGKYISDIINDIPESQKTLKYLCDAIITDDLTKLSNVRSNTQPMFMQNKYNKSGFSSNVNTHNLMNDIFNNKYKELTPDELSELLIDVGRDMCKFVEEVLLDDTYGIYKYVYDNLDKDKEKCTNKVNTYLCKYVESVLYNIPNEVYKLNSEEHVKNAIDDARGKGVVLDIGADIRFAYMIYNIILQILPSMGADENILTTDKDNFNELLINFISTCDIIHNISINIINKLLETGKFKRVVE